MHRGNIQMSGYGNISRHYIRWLSGVLLSLSSALSIATAPSKPLSWCRHPPFNFKDLPFNWNPFFLQERMRLCECRMEWKSCHILVRRKKRRLLPDKVQVRLPTIVQGVWTGNDVVTGVLSVSLTS